MSVRDTVRPNGPIKLGPPTQKHKKFSVVFPDGKRTNFGDNRYQDYTQHGDKKRRASYISRHRARGSKTRSGPKGLENHTKSGMRTAGWWSRYLLWGDSPSISGNIRNIEKRFGVDVKK